MRDCSSREKPEITIQAIKCKAKYNIQDVNLATSSLEDTRLIASALACIYNGILAYIISTSVDNSAPVIKFSYSVLRDNFYSRSVETEIEITDYFWYPFYF